MRGSDSCYDRNAGRGQRGSHSTEGGLDRTRGESTCKGGVGYPDEYHAVHGRARSSTDHWGPEPGARRTRDLACNVDEGEARGRPRRRTGANASVPADSDASCSHDAHGDLAPVGEGRACATADNAASRKRSAAEFTESGDMARHQRAAGRIAAVRERVLARCTAGGAATHGSGTEQLRSDRLRDTVAPLGCDDAAAPKRDRAAAENVEGGDEKRRRLRGKGPLLRRVAREPAQVL